MAHEPFIDELFLIFNEKTLIYLSWMLYDDNYYDGERVMIQDGTIREITHETIFEKRQIIDLEHSGRFVFCDSFPYENVKEQILVSPLNQFFTYDFMYLMSFPYFDHGKNAYECEKQGTQVITKIITEYP